MQHQVDDLASIIVAMHLPCSELAATSESPCESSAEQSVTLTSTAPVKLPELTPPAAAVVTAADTQQLTSSHHSAPVDGTAFTNIPIVRPFSPVTTTATKYGSFRKSSAGSRIAFGCVNSPLRTSASTATVADTAAVAEPVSKAAVSQHAGVSAVENDVSSDSTATEAAASTTAATGTAAAATAAVRIGKLVRPVARRGHAKTNSAAELELPVAEITADIDTIEPAVAALSDIGTAAVRKGSSSSSASSTGQLHEPIATARGATASIAVDSRRYVTAVTQLSFLDLDVM
jgi:hypothetical protein